MKGPNWKNCDEEGLWKYVAFHLASVGIDCVLVGGAVVAIYSDGAYRSGDLDFIVERQALEKTKRTLEKLVGITVSESIGPSLRSLVNPCGYRGSLEVRQLKRFFST